ncbi:MAG: S1C family serine protease [bacterium]
MFFQRRHSIGNIIKNDEYEHRFGYKIKSKIITKIAASFLSVFLLTFLSILMFAGFFYLESFGSNAKAYASNYKSGSIVEKLFHKMQPSIVHIQVLGLARLKNGAIMPEEDIGTGFFVNKNGDILTNFHVIGNANKIEISFLKYKNVKADIVGTDPSSDIAIIHINPKGRKITPVVFGDSNNLKVGERVMAIGNPYNLYQTVTTGIISGLKRSLVFPTASFYGNIIQTDAAINFGNSGGPLVNYRGHVIGINTAKLAGEAQNIGFAIPINLAKRNIPELIKYGRIIKPWLGIEAIKVTKSFTRLFGIKNVNKGLLVEKVFSGSPAYKAGIRAGKRIIQMKAMTYVLGGDIITRINNKKVDSFSSLERMINSFVPGQLIVLKIHINNKVKFIKVKLGALPPSLT